MRVQDYGSQARVELRGQDDDCLRRLYDNVREYGTFDRRHSDGSLVEYDLRLSGTKEMQSEAGEESAVGDDVDILPETEEKGENVTRGLEIPLSVENESGGRDDVVGVDVCEEGEVGPEDGAEETRTPVDKSAVCVNIVQSLRQWTDHLLERHVREH